MNSFSPAIINKLQAARRATFADYDAITLDHSATRIFARLFVNPDCQTDLDLFALEEPEVKLSFLGDHIITAGPSTIAQYAQKRGITAITEGELLRCFAVDHAHDVHDNHVADHKSPAYALAHILLPSRVVALTDMRGAVTADLSFRTSWGAILFKHVVVPRDMTVVVGDRVYHHFGVIIAHETNRAFSRKLLENQDKLSFIQELGRITAQKKLTIDFSDVATFKKDVLGLILKPHRAQRIKNPSDLKGKKITFKN